MMIPSSGFMQDQKFKIREKIKVATIFHQKKNLKKPMYYVPKLYS